VLLDHVEVVQQPLPGGADVEIPLRGLREPVVRVGQDAAGIVEPLQQAVAGARRPLGQPLGPGQLARALREELRAEQLATDRACEELLQTGAKRLTSETAGKSGRQREAGDGDSRGSGDAKTTSVAGR
jgi:hypothetical protein